jgi:murein DD-endopeptidase MepM/ murein hydrolase activator NlpD
MVYACAGRQRRHAVNPSVSRADFPSVRSGVGLPHMFGNQAMLRWQREHVRGGNHGPGTQLPASTIQRQRTAEEAPKLPTVFAPSAVHPLRGEGTYVRGVQPGHAGVDISAAQGTPVVAVLGGSVTTQSGCVEGDPQ